jgi:hypothetical protein
LIVVVVCDQGISAISLTVPVILKEASSPPLSEKICVSVGAAESTYWAEEPSWVQTSDKYR